MIPVDGTPKRNAHSWLLLELSLPTFSIKPFSFFVSAVEDGIVFPPKSSMEKKFGLFALTPES